MSSSSPNDFPLRAVTVDSYRIAYGYYTKLTRMANFFGRHEFHSKVSCVEFKSPCCAGPSPAIFRVMESELSLHGTALATKSDLRDLELKLETLRADLIGEIKGTVRWNFAFWIAQLAAVAGILKLLK